MKISQPEISNNCHGAECALYLCILELITCEDAMTKMQIHMISHCYDVSYNCLLQNVFFDDGGESYCI